MHETIEARWWCQQVLEAADDVRAPVLLDGLIADVRARAAELAGAGDPDRQIGELPIYREVAAARQRQAGSATSPRP